MPTSKSNVCDSAACNLILPESIYSQFNKTTDQKQEADQKAFPQPLSHSNQSFTQPGIHQCQADSIFEGNAQFFTITK